LDVEIVFVEQPSLILPYIPSWGLFVVARNVMLTDPTVPALVDMVVWPR
jgi:hypothetical protein